MANKTKIIIPKNFLKSINELKKINNKLKKKTFKLNLFKKTKRKLPKRPKKSKTRKHRGGG